MNDDTLVSRSQAARVAGVTKATIDAWILSGRLVPVREGRAGRTIRPDDLLAAQEAAHAGGVVPRWRHDVHYAAARLRALRLRAGWSQEDLAAEAGIAHEVVSRLERGQRAPSAETVRKLARSLGVSAERFVDEDPAGPTLLSAAQAADHLGVPVNRVREWVKAGELPGTKVARQWRIRAIDVIALDRGDRLRGRSRRLDPRHRGWGHSGRTA